MIFKQQYLNLFALYALAVQGALQVKTLIFDNTNNCVSIEFSEPTIIENIFLMRKTSEEEICVPVQSLNSEILVPLNYQENLEKYKDFKSYYESSITASDYDENSKKALADKRKMREYESKVKVSRVEVGLEPQVFDQKTVYLFNVKDFEQENNVYTEEFVYNDSGFEHKSSSDSGSWYSSPWPWIAIGFIVLSFFLIVKIAFC